MKILPCTSDMSDLLSFVLPYEKLATGFVGHILRGDSRFFLVRTDENVACDAFSFSDGGQIFHCLPDAYGERRGELLRVLTEFFRAQKQHEFFNIIGEEKGTDLIKLAVQNATGRTTRHDQNYVLLEESAAKNAVACTDFDNLALVQCTPMMLGVLLPLQIAYEKEEVVWQDDQLNENVTRLSFLHALKTQQIFVLSKGGAYIAKAGTNALGKKYAQLGGIYTVPSERGKGYADCLVRHVITKLHEQGKRAVLFAKPENTSALRLYEKCGFKKIGRYEIAYF